MILRLLGLFFFSCCVQGALALCMLSIEENYNKRRAVLSLIVPAFGQLIFFIALLYVVTAL